MEAVAAAAASEPPEPAPDGEAEAEAGAGAAAPAAGAAPAAAMQEDGEEEEEEGGEADAAMAEAGAPPAAEVYRLLARRVVPELQRILVQKDTVRAPVALAGAPPWLPAACCLRCSVLAGLVRAGWGVPGSDAARWPTACSGLRSHVGAHPAPCSPTLPPTRPMPGVQSSRCCSCCPRRRCACSCRARCKRWQTCCARACRARGAWGLLGAGAAALRPPLGAAGMP